MRFALLGIDEDTLLLARALAKLPQARLVLASSECADQVQEFVPGIQRFEEWESLLVSHEIDAVIVASTADQGHVDESLRKLVQEAVPIVVSHPVCDSLLAYELEMIRTDSGGVLLPFFPGRGHPAIERLASLVVDNEPSPLLGSIEEIVLERRLVDRDHQGVMRWLPRDINFIRQLVGDITSVSAIGNRKGDSRFSNLSIHLVGQDNLTARWSLTSAPDASAGGRAVLHGDSGIAVLKMPQDGHPWTLELPGNPPGTEGFDLWNDAAALVEAVERAHEGKGSRPNWLDVCTDLDVCDTTERSLRRKRTIEVRQDDRSEESAFKGVMSAVGCSLLMVALVILLFAAVIEGFRMPFADSRPAEAETASLPLLIRLWPVYPLLVFLAMQALLIVAKRSGVSRGESVISNQ